MLGMQCRLWIYATRTHNREQPRQLLLANLFLWPTEPLTEASVTKSCEKKNIFVLNLVTFHLSWLLFPPLQPFHKLVTRTSQAATFQKSLEIHLLDNPIAPY